MLEKIKNAIFMKDEPHEHEFKFIEVLSTKIFDDQGKSYKQSRELLKCLCGKETTIDVLQEL